MKALRRLLILVLCLMAPWQSPASGHAPTMPGALASQTAAVLPARVLAVGIPGIGAVAGVGFFHPGGPIHDQPALAAFTQPGRVLHAKRVLIATSSNFGATRAIADWPEGAILSLDPDGPTMVIPGTFAQRGDQATALDGRVQLFTAQSPAFLNGVNNPAAATASLPPVSNPLGISINNAFGRLWFANSPLGTRGLGTESICDPGGQPLAGAPSRLLGGVYAGDLTNRPQQILSGGLRAGAVANALLGMSPDGGKRAVFAVLTMDGAIAQAHTEQALDGLAPAGTITPIPIVSGAPGSVAFTRFTRAGMLLNWVPERILYVSDPVRNAIVALRLTTDPKVFRVQDVRRLVPPELSAPVDLAPVVPEVGNAEFSSNTSLAGGSDLYVLNRGNGTIVRMRQDGTVVAVRRIAVAGGPTLGAGRLNGIAVSPDAQKIWVTVTGTVPQYPEAPGALMEVPAFGPGRSAVREREAPAAARPQVASAALIDRGAQVFGSAFTPAQGLGPLFNGRSCVECHATPASGGMGQNGLAVVFRVGRFDGQSFDPLVGSGGPVARAHSVAELGVPCALATGPPPAANVISTRNAPPLFGSGLIDGIPDDVIRAGAVARGTVAGHPNIVRDSQGRERVGRFGWKADTATLEQFVAEAFRNELGITNPLAPRDLVPAGARCGNAQVTAFKDNGTLVRAVTAYVASLPSPSYGSTPSDQPGAKVFAETGCAACHVPALSGANVSVPLYSDLLLHDMGPSLDDGVVQGQARGKDWRTTPLWGLRTRQRFLHDGRATSVAAAIQAHDGEAGPAATAFRRLPETDRGVLLAFLLGL